MTLSEKYEKYKKLDPKIWIISYILVSAFLIYWYPPVQVSYFGINNATSNATLENQYRVTLTQIIGGGAVAIGIYFAWKNFLIAQEALNISQKSQITERFTRAIDQLVNENLEIKLGGIYALERISSESENDYWPIMEILTAYVRKNSPFKNGAECDKISLDIQAILTIIGRRKYSFNAGELNRLDLQKTNLIEADLKGAHLEGTNLEGANLKEAHLEEAHLEEALFKYSQLIGSILKGAYLSSADLAKADLKGANLEGANFEGANLEGTHNLSFDQLSKVKTLYDAKLGEEFLIPLKEKYPFLFEKHD